MPRTLQSPFYPGPPVPADLFVGRADEIERIVEAARETLRRRPKALFLKGESGVGKTSLANLLRLYLERQEQLLGIHVVLGGKRATDDALLAVVAKLFKSLGKLKTGTAKRLKATFKNYVSDISLFGAMTLKLNDFKADLGDVQEGFLPFLQTVRHEAAGEYEGIFLILDDINGLSGTPEFAPFLKALLDDNAMQGDDQVPLLLLLCGLPERLDDLGGVCPPLLDRYLDVIELGPMPRAEAEAFFRDTFAEADLVVEDAALELLLTYSMCFPKLMQLVGDHAFDVVVEAGSRVVSVDAALDGAIAAAEDVGRRHVDKAVVRALRSKDYHSILKKAAKGDVGNILDGKLVRSELAARLGEGERAKLDNLLQRLKTLLVVEPGAQAGEWVFRDPLVALYLWLKYWAPPTPEERTPSPEA